MNAELPEGRFQMAPKIINSDGRIFVQANRGDKYLAGD